MPHGKRWASKEKEREYNARRYARAREWLYQFKQQPCTDCGNKYPEVCMQFDHVPGRGYKEFEVNLNSANTRARDAVLKEMLKCDLVCANCHCLRTANRRNLL